MLHVESSLVNCHWPCDMPGSSPLRIQKAVYCLQLPVDIIKRGSKRIAASYIHLLWGCWQKTFIEPERFRKGCLREVTPKLRAEAHWEMRMSEVTAHREAVEKHLNILSKRRRHQRVWCVWGAVGAQNFKIKWKVRKTCSRSKRRTTGVGVFRGDIILSSGYICKVGFMSTGSRKIVQ